MAAASKMQNVGEPALVTAGADGWMGRAGRGLAMWAVVCGVLIAWQWPILTMPPYEDQAAGLWTEADFLATTGFDYYRLRYEEPHYMSATPGARSYVISILPGALALLMLASSNVEVVIVVAHLVVLGFTALILVLCYGAARRHVGRVAATLICVAVATNPVFDVQSQMVGLDMPQAALMMVAVALLWRDRFVWASLASLGAFLMKATGGIVTVAGIIYLASVLSLRSTRLDRRLRNRCVAGLLAHVVVFLLQMSLISIGDDTAAHRRGIPWPAAMRLPGALWSWTPEVAVLLGATAMLSGAWAWRAVRTWRGGGALWDGGIGRELWLGWLVVGGIAVSNVALVVIFLPRYLTGAIPLVVLMFGLLSVGWGAGRRWGSVVLVLLIGWNVANLYGRFYAPIATLGEAAFRVAPLQYGPFAERSREYLEVQRARERAMRLVSEQFADHPILAAVPERFYLEKPRLGYVDRPLRVLMADDSGLAVESYVKTMQGRQEGGRPPLLVRTGRAEGSLPEPKGEDRIVFDDEFEVPLVIFMQDTPEREPLTADAWEAKYMEETFPGFWPYAHVAGLMAHGRSDLALRAARELVGLQPEDARAWEMLDRLVLPHRYPRVTEMDEAMARGLARLQYDTEWPVGDEPSEEANAYARGVGWLERGDWKLAESSFLEALESKQGEPQAALADLALGFLGLAAGRLGEAEAYFEEALRLQPDLAEAHQGLGLIRAQQQQWAAAREQFEEALRMAPEYASAHYSLASVLARTGQVDQAEAHLARGAELIPTQPTGR